MAKALSKGIFLEDINTLLPWNTPIDELRNIANPVVEESSDRIRLFWNDHVIFDGIRSQIQAVFYRNRGDISDHPNANDKLRIVSLSFYDIDELDPRELHERLKAEFTRAFGTPSFDGSGEVPFSDLPFTEWNLIDALVVLMVFERFGEYCVGEVWHKPLPAWRRAYPKSA